MKSYSSTSFPVLERLHELRVLYRSHTRGAGRRASNVIEEMCAIERAVREAAQLELRGAHVLEVGPGQLQGHMTWLALRNQAVGIDPDVSPQGLRGYLRLLRRNGFTRFYKTLGRRLLGIDRRYRGELKRQLGVDRLPRLDIRQMDATRMSFPDGHFDFVFSRSVFEHIAEPAAAVREVARVLRSGGCAYIVVHLYTSDSGCHDPRILGGQRGDLPMWAHLREAFAHRVRPNSFLNRVRLAEWQSIFEAHMPGARLSHRRDTNPAAQAALDEIRGAGELEDHSDDELLTVALDVLWTKP